VQVKTSIARILTLGTGIAVIQWQACSRFCLVEENFERPLWRSPKLLQLE